MAQYRQFTPDVCIKAVVICIACGFTMAERIQPFIHGVAMGWAPGCNATKWYFSYTGKKYPISIPAWGCRQLN